MQRDGQRRQSIVSSSEAAKKEKQVGFIAILLKKPIPKRLIRPCRFGIKWNPKEDLLARNILRHRDVQ